MGSVRCVPFPRARATLRLAAQLTPTRRRRAPRTARSYLWNSREIEWSCPGGTQPAYLWQEFKPTSLDKITGKLTGGPGCMASVTFKGERVSRRLRTHGERKDSLRPVTTLGTEAQFGGAVGPQGVTYGCSCTLLWIPAGSSRPSPSTCSNIDIRFSSQRGQGFRLLHHSGAGKLDMSVPRALLLLLFPHGN
jgi:hypothetical protein